jgi:hypothetical protein
VAAPASIPAFQRRQRWGVRVGTVDALGDGKAEIHAALGPKGKPEVRIFSGVPVTALDSFFAEAANFRKGLLVAGSR